jgi:diacylglycerol kinase
MIGLVLAAELVNTALEHTLDGLHAEQAEFVRIARTAPQPRCWCSALRP